MAGLDFKAPVSQEEESEESIQHNTRIGLILFAVYVLFYAGFMGISVISPELMSTPSIAGLNLSISYGFGLILLALVLALLYMVLCKQSNAGSKK